MGVGNVYVVVVVVVVTVDGDVVAIDDDAVDKIDDCLGFSLSHVVVLHSIFEVVVVGYHYSGDDGTGDVDHQVL